LANFSIPIETSGGVFDVKPLKAEMGNTNCTIRVHGFIYEEPI